MCRDDCGFHSCKVLSYLRLYGLLRMLLWFSVCMLFCMLLWFNLKNTCGIILQFCHCFFPGRFRSDAAKWSEESFCWWQVVELSWVVDTINTNVLWKTALNAFLQYLQLGLFQCLLSCYIWKVKLQIKVKCRKLNTE